MTSPFRNLRFLRMLMPLVAIATALALFLGVGLMIGFGAFGGFGGGIAGGPCDASLGPSDSTGVALTARMNPATLSSEQRRNAEVVIGVAKGMNLPPRAWLIGLATAMQESGLRNLQYGDRDSLGMFQQRPSQGWGSPSQVTNPVYSSTKFFQHLAQIPGWEQLPITAAAQAVQRSAFPDAYARWEGLAARLVAVLAGVADPTGCGVGGIQLSQGVVRAALGFAMNAVGKPYVWGATGPNAYDCSGLIMRAYQGAGIFLPRVSREQYQAGGHVPVRSAQPGDLLFLATDRSDPATIHHVMIYLGNNMLVEAPYTGKPVRARPVDWNNPELVPLATRPGTAPNPA
ncbi:MAG TPA: C40 family peptidase [Pseudonocardia sp.]|nr:C40 family peptidase [Pseudonocardia sp.]